MEFEWHGDKEDANVRKHGLDFSFARLVFADGFRVLVYDRHEGGEHRWHMFGIVAGRLLLVVHTYPDEGNEDRVRVIGIRSATREERRRFEEHPHG